MTGQTDWACECGEITGEACAWRGPMRETAVVDVVPAYLRASHAAASRSPHNDAVRLRVAPACADQLLEDHAEWADLIDVPSVPVGGR